MLQSSRHLATERPLKEFMLKIIRILINPIIDKNLEILNLLSRIRYYMGFPFYLYSLKFNKEYLGGYLFSDQEAGRERQKISRGDEYSLTIIAEK